MALTGAERVRRHREKKRLQKSLELSLEMVCYITVFIQQLQLNFRILSRQKKDLERKKRKLLRNK